MVFPKVTARNINGWFLNSIALLARQISAHKGTPSPPHTIPTAVFGEFHTFPTTDSTIGITFFTRFRLDYNFHFFSIGINPIDWIVKNIRIQIQASGLAQRVFCHPSAKVRRIEAIAKRDQPLPGVRPLRHKPERLRERPALRQQIAERVVPVRRHCLLRAVQHRLDVAARVIHITILPRAGAHVQQPADAAAQVQPPDIWRVTV